jgi:NDP-sugar pyrophosphorylase family protein
MLTDTFICIPADTILDLDINAVMSMHRASGNIATCVVHTGVRTDQRRFKVDANGNVLGLAASFGKDTAWCDTGVYVFEPEALDYIPHRTSFDIYGQLIPALLAAGQRVSCFYAVGYWNMLESVQGYQAAQERFLTGFGSDSGRLEAGILSAVVPSWKSKEISQGVQVGRYHRIHRDATIIPPVSIGENCLIGSKVTLGPDVVIGENVIVDDGACVTGSTLLDHTYVGQGMTIENALVTRNVVIDLTSGECVTVANPALLGDTLLLRIQKSVMRIADIFLAVLFLLLSLPFSVVIGLWLRVTTGKVIQRIPHLALQPVKWTGSQPDTIWVFDLYRFNTSQIRNKWIEKLELNRIPELWNVIRGDMRFVGLSPLPLKEAARMPELWQKLRQSHPPGFTGMWYVETSCDEDFDDRLIADAYYFATHSLGQDLQLLLKTVPAWLRRIRTKIKGDQY